VPCYRCFILRPLPTSDAILTRAPTLRRGTFLRGVFVGNGLSVEPTDDWLLRAYFSLDDRMARHYAGRGADIQAPWRSSP
jgi:hypothetical protein